MIAMRLQIHFRPLLAGLFAILLAWGDGRLSAQVSAYNFASTTTPYVPITGGSTFGTGTLDDVAFNDLPIGFNFVFDCLPYTIFSINTNGFIVLGDVATTSYVPLSGGSSNRVISALGMNLDGATGLTELRSELLGTAPNRTRVIQWSNFCSFGAAGDSYSFQIRLNEGNNTIEIHYGSFTKDATNRTPQVGLRGNSNADYNNRLVPALGSWAASLPGIANTSTCQLQTSLMPAAGLKYTYTPSSVGMSYVSSTVTNIAAGGNAPVCDQGSLMSRIEVVVTGNCASPIYLSQVVLDMTGTAPLSSVSRVRLYSTGASAAFSAFTEILPGGLPPAATVTFNAVVPLLLGNNYFWIAYDFNGTGTVGQTIGADMPANSVTVDDLVRTPTATPNCLRTFTACGAYPSNPTLWMRADAGTSTTTDGAAVASWASTGGSVPITVPQGTANRRPLFKNGSGNTTNNRFNYNPYVLFDGVNDLLIVTGTYDFGDGRSTGPGLTTFATMGWTSGVVAYEWNGPNGTTKTKGDASIVITNGAGLLGSNNHTLYPTAFQATVTDGMGRENGIEGRCNAIGQALRSNNNPSLVTDRVAIGGNVNTGEFMNGGDAEWLIFNYMMSNAQRLEVETYLAIKYGTTLGTTALPSNYLSSAGTIIWTGDNTYQNNVIGIGRDGTSTLLQKQSHNYDDTVRIYKGTLALTNQLNAATFAVDRSFVMVGANMGNMCSTAATNAEMPAACGLYSRLDREWKVTRTNMAENFNMDFKLNACANPTSVNVADLRLLVDDDGNFGNGGTTCYQNGDGSGIVFTYTNPVITVSNFNTTHIPNNATRYITIASVSPGTPLPIVLMDFRAQCQEGQVSLSWKTAPQSQEDHFDLERSEDGSRFVSIARISGQNSNSQIQKYVAADQLAPRQALYYRLHGVAEDGGMTSTEIVHLDATDCGQAQAFGLYPNPASGNTVQLAYIMEEDAQVTLQIINSLGQVCGQSELHLEEGSHVATLSTEQLAPGYYLVQILSNKWETKPLRFVKQ